MIVIIGSIAAVLGILAIVYFINMDGINNWIRLKTMDDEEYGEMIRDRFIDILDNDIFAAAKYAPDLSGGAEFKMNCSLDRQTASLIGLQRDLKVIANGTADFGDGMLNLRLDPYAEDVKGTPVNLTRVDTTLDFPQKRLFVRIPEFDDMTLELTSLYSNGLNSLLADIEPIIDVDKVVKSLADTFGKGFGDGGLFERLRSTEKSRELKRDETFWGIGLKEGKECDIVESKCEFAGFDLDVRIFADDDGEIIGAEVKINTGKNRLGIMLDLMPGEEQESEASDNKIRFGSSYEVSLDGLKLFNGIITSDTDEEGGSAETVIGVEPGKLLKSFVGGDDISASVRVKARDEQMTVSVTADTGSEKNSQIELYLGKLCVSKPEILGRGEVTDISGLNIADYGDLGKLAEFAVEKVEALDLQILRDYIDAYIKKYVNKAAGYEMIREFWSNGMLAKVISVLTGDVNPVSDFIPGAGTHVDTEIPGVSSETEESELPSDEDGQGGEDAAAEESSAQESETEDPHTDDKAASETEGTGNASDKSGEEAGAEAGHEAAEGSGAEAIDTEEAEPEKKELTPEEKAKLRSDFLNKYRYSYPIEAEDPKADWGDEVVMDIVPLIMGMPYMEAQYKDAYAYLGEQWYGEGTDEQVIGASVGDVLEVEATLGDDFGAFSGYHGKFRVTIKAIHKYIRPEWSESFIVGVMGYDSLEDCEEKLLASLD
ncbi:MAG: hypothetical protein K6F44_04725 [Lachnospiraceae bacterium]|nr:hypothetical protein [Lachnospiraceae bacterium]